MILPTPKRELAILVSEKLSFAKHFGEGSVKKKILVMPDGNWLAHTSRSF
jgi:hypothetical protein